MTEILAFATNLLTNEGPEWILIFLMGYAYWKDRRDSRREIERQRDAEYRVKLQIRDALRDVLRIVRELPKQSSGPG